MAKIAGEAAAPRRVSWKEAATMCGLLILVSGVVMSVVAWVHAESTVPKILNKTQEQIERAIQRHSERPHAAAASLREVEILQKAIQSEIQAVEKSIVEFKDDSRGRLDRIEAKIDRGM